MGRKVWDLGLGPLNTGFTVLSLQHNQTFLLFLGIYFQGVFFSFMNKTIISLNVKVLKKLKTKIAKSFLKLDISTK